MAKRRIKSGLPPGSLVHIGTPRIHVPAVSVFHYCETSYEELLVENLDEFLAKDLSKDIVWINVDGLHQSDLIAKIGAKFNLHSLMLEDVMNSDQRPKVESYDNCLFLTLRMLSYNKETNTIEQEQVSLVLGENYVISFEEDPGDVFGPIRDRIRSGKGRVRKSKADYLFYALVDVIVDNYFAVIESLGEEIEGIEEDVFENPDTALIEEIQEIKKNLIFLRRAVYPLREAIGRLEKEDSKLVSNATSRFFRDVYDHIVHVMDSIETYRDITSGLKDIYMSNISFKMNNIMKVLTVISTIFIPLTFIVGVYGMNFKYMPELEWHQGYFVIWGIMLLIAITMMVYFRRKKWF